MRARFGGQRAVPAAAAPAPRACLAGSRAMGARAPSGTESAPGVGHTIVAFNCETVFFYYQIPNINLKNNL